MKYTPIIQRLKARCPTFDQRVAGAAEYENLRTRSNMVVPAAYVIPLDDNPGENETENGYQQTLTETFAVVVVISNSPDERGQGSSEQLHDLRKEIWRALLGWEPDEDYESIIYQGGNLLHLDRNRLDYQYEFSAETVIAETDTSIPDQYDALPAFESMKIEVDHQTLPPDGDIDHTIIIEPTQ